MGKGAAEDVTHVVVAGGSRGCWCENVMVKRCSRGERSGNGGKTKHHGLISCYFLTPKQDYEEGGRGRDDHFLLLVPWLCWHYLLRAFSSLENSVVHVVMMQCITFLMM